MNMTIELYDMTDCLRNYDNLIKITMLNCYHCAPECNVYDHIFQ